MIKKWTIYILFLLAIGLVSVGLVQGQFFASESFSGNVTVGGANAVAGTVICMSGSGDDCISVSPNGRFGGAGASADKLVAVCDAGDTIAFTLSGSGCTGLAIPTRTCAGGGSFTQIRLTFSGSCAASTSAASTGGGGGGGSPGGLAGPSVGDATDLGESSSFNAGESTTVSMTQGDSVTFKIGGEEYSISLSTLTDDYVVLQYGDEFVTLKPGESTTVDVNGDGTKDVQVTLQGIEGGEAVLVFKKLSEVSTQEEQVEAEKKAEEAKAEEEAKAPLQGIILTIIIVVLGLAGYYVYVHRKK
jgi:hypothetical protein